MRVIQMGLQRTGTNAARALVEANLGIQVDSRNKHRAPTRSLQPGEGALVTFRPPAEWCWSVYRYRKNKYAHMTPPVPLDFSRAFIDDALEEWVHVASRQLHAARSEEHTSELQSRGHLVCRLLLEKKNTLKSRRGAHTT